MLSGLEKVQHVSLFDLRYQVSHAASDQLLNQRHISVGKDDDSWAAGIIRNLAKLKVDRINLRLVELFRQRFVQVALHNRRDVWLAFDHDGQ